VTGAASEDEAVEVARSAGWPVALKAASEQWRHRLDVGAVRLDLVDERELREAWQAVVALTGEDGGTPSASPTAAPHDMAQVDQDSVLGRLSLTSVAWGTRLDLTCSYEEPGGYHHDDLPPTYSLVVHTRDGGTEQVASWKGLPGRTMHLTGATALSADQIRSVEVLTAEGQPVLELTS
jgi:hypothetical protein